MAREINTSINSWDEAALVAGNYLGVSAGVYRVLVVLADTLYCSDEHLAAGQEGELRQVHGRAAGGPHGARVHGGGVRGVRGVRGHGRGVEQPQQRAEVQLAQARVHHGHRVGHVRHGGHVRHVRHRGHVGEVRHGGHGAGDEAGEDSVRHGLGDGGGGGGGARAVRSLGAGGGRLGLLGGDHGLGLVRNFSCRGGGGSSRGRGEGREGGAGGRVEGDGHGPLLAVVGDLGLEAVLRVRGVGHGAHAAVRVRHAVAAGHHVALAALLARLGVAGHEVRHRVAEVVVGGDQLLLQHHGGGGGGHHAHALHGGGGGGHGDGGVAEVVGGEGGGPEHGGGGVAHVCHVAGGRVRHAGHVGGGGGGGHHGAEGGGGAEVGQGADQGDTRRHAVREQRPAQGQGTILRL